MEPELIGYILLLMILAIPGYTAYLFVVDPWSREKKRRKLHTLSGHEWVKTDDGGMAIDTDEWTIYVYK